MYNITFQQIETFLAVAERLNLSETANALYISQPALSKMIQRLEEGVGMKLFLRSNRGVALTPEGKYLYDRLKAPYRTICRSIDVAKTMSGGSRRAIRIGYPSTYDLSRDYDALKRQISEFSRAHGEIELVETLYEFDALKEAFIYGDADVIFAHTFITDQLRDAAVKPVLRSEMCVAMPASHPLAKEERPDLVALDGEVFFCILLDSEQASIARMEALLAEYGITPREVKVVPNFQSLIRSVRLGRGLAMCGNYPMAAGAEEIRFLTVEGEGEKPCLSAVWRPGNRSEDVRLFIDSLQEMKE